jgi:hypothetical protein
VDVGLWPKWSIRTLFPLSFYFFSLSLARGDHLAAPHVFFNCSMFNSFSSRTSRMLAVAGQSSYVVVASPLGITRPHPPRARRPRPTPRPTEAVHPTDRSSASVSSHACNGESMLSFPLPLSPLKPTAPLMVLKAAVSSSLSSPSPLPSSLFPL